MKSKTSFDLHAPTRRDMLLGSGALFAWAFVPKLARAEGRDPRFLTIVLRGALDGLAPWRLGLYYQSRAAIAIGALIVQGILSVRCGERHTTLEERAWK